MYLKIDKISKDRFKVNLDDTTFKVTLDDDYYQELTEGKCSKEELIGKSFKFLLKREPKESILREFNLKIIKKYFPEYEERIK